jgi:hypothetical protein
MVSVNWTKVLQKCTPSTKKTILHARSTHEDLRRMISDLESGTPKLNFAEYAKVLVDGRAVGEAEDRVKSWRGGAERDLTADLKALESERDKKVSFLLNCKFQSLTCIVGRVSEICGKFGNQNFCSQSAIEPLGDCKGGR